MRYNERSTPHEASITYGASHSLKAAIATQFLRLVAALPLCFPIPSSSYVIEVQRKISLAPWSMFCIQLQENVMIKEIMGLGKCDDLRGFYGTKNNPQFKMFAV